MKLLLGQPSTSNISENISLPGGSGSELSVSESSCKFYETSNNKQKSDTTQNREQYFYFSQCCNRYNISDRAGAALATSVLIDHDIIESNDTKFAEVGSTAVLSYRSTVPWYFFSTVIGTVVTF